jgi:hypothetical protein
MTGLSPRPYQSEEDFWHIRDFLREVFLLNDRRMFCWPVARLDYWRWHGILNLGDGALDKDVFLWETDDQQIVAVLNCEEPEAFRRSIRDENRNSEEQVIIRLKSITCSQHERARVVGLV